MRVRRAVLCVPLLVIAAMASADSAARREFAAVMKRTPDEVHGRELFQACAVCHGDDAGGSVNGSVPRIAGQHYRVLVRQVVDFRLGRRWDPRMEGVADRHGVIADPRDIADVAGYVSRLRNDGRRGVRDGQDVGRGAAIYAAHCRSCHGEEAGGSDEKGVPRLAGQHASYLARQIYDAVDGRRPELARSHGKLFGPFEYLDVMGLTDYLARIGWQSDPK